MSKPSYDYLFKILLIGDSSVGKSSILLRYTDDAFTTSFISTIGIDFKIKIVTYNDKKIKLQIWDTAGQERFRGITHAYYKAAMAILLVYDVSDLRSFQNVNNWMQNIKMHAPENAIVTLVGNKCDKDKNYERVVTYEMGQTLADKLNVKFVETSAKKNINIDKAFGGIIDDLAKLVVNDHYNVSTSIRIQQSDENSDQQHNNSRSCCK